MLNLYITPTSAHIAGAKAVANRRAKSYRVKFAKLRNPDRSVDAGYLVVLQGK